MGVAHATEGASDGTTCSICGAGGMVANCGGIDQHCGCDIALCCAIESMCGGVASITARHWGATVCSAVGAVCV